MPASPLVVDKDPLFEVKVFLGALLTALSVAYIAYLALTEQRRRKRKAL